MQFIFPSQEVSMIGSLQQAKRVIKSMLVFQNLSIYCSYQFQLIRGMYIYCKCKNCTARLVFKKREGVFVLYRAKYKHQHRKIGANKLVVIQAIQGLPACFNTKTIKQQMMSKFNISEATFYRYLRQSKTYGNTLSDVLARLQNQGVFGVSINNDQQQQIPTLLLLTSQQMIEKYYRNGKNVKFDLTYNLIRQKTINQQQYAVGVFVSVNNNLTIEPHCLVIMADESKLNFIRAFSEFFILMKSSPNFIFTDEQKNIQLALEELKQRQIFKGYHYIDIFHVLRNAKKSLFHKPSINYLLSMSRSSNIVQYKYRRQICRERVYERDNDAFNKFEQKMERCCLALIEPTFVGLSCTTACCQKINDIIKNKVPYSQKYISVVSTISKLLTQMVNKAKTFNIEKIKLEQFTAITQIQQLRKRLHKRVFRRIMFQLSTTITCIVNLTQIANTYEVIEQDFQDDAFIVRFSPEGKWSCECELTEKIGLPCAHILKIILLLKQKIISSINAWWLFDEAQVSKKKSSLNFPRKTRRHRR